MAHDPPSFTNLRNAVRLSFLESMERQSRRGGRLIEFPRSEVHYSAILSGIFGRLEKRVNLPPGPPGLPLLGNIFQMPTEAPWLTYVAWAKKYAHHLLNLPQAASDLLDRRSAIYSDRPDLIFGGDCEVGYKDTLPLCKYGDTFHLLETPDLFMDHIRLLVARIGFEISHGYSVQGRDDPMVLVAEQANRDFAKAMAPGAYLCDVFPILRHIPDWTGARFKKEAKECRKTMEALRDDPYNALKERVALGTAKPSFTTSLIQREEHPTEAQEMLYKWSSVSVYTTAADTTVSAMGSIFVALSLYPEVQKKAQEELDSVVGPDRLPSFDDRPNLPYLNAIVTEIHRWNPVAPLGVPHRSTQEDVYNGYRIPLGSILFANNWGILHDENIYPAPMEFNPERYLREGKEAADGVNPDPRRFAFGYGRRLCPGKELADDSIFICAAMTLATFNLTRPKSSAAEPQYTSSLICHPLPFPCSITPRSGQAENLVLLAVANGY
ncbi:cytochrome P450 [Mycena rosella]|uniref:Cytochrome P450 n=1 Tax=Mycena rosella TaxID=1033263 RepID=A0AAD7CZS7_MYCRO|nr:cytochrome P450 [Mycena rosella]